MKASNLQFGIFFCVLIGCASSCHTNSEDYQGLDDHQIYKFSTYAKVWGFLKYYHPGLSNGEVDWDSVFIADLPQILNSKNKKFEKYLENLISTLGEVKQCDSCENIFMYPTEWSRNIDLDWIYENSLISDSQSNQLQNILDNRHQGKGHYVQYAWGDGNLSGPVKFINEKTYNDSLLLNDYRYRVLALARYWNAIEYFFAYKYLLSKDWNQVLFDYFPILYIESSQLDYHLNIMRLTSEIEDSHSGSTHSQYLFNEVWDKRAPFDLVTIGGKTIVKEITYKTLNSVNDILVGDEILLIDSVQVDDIREEISAYCGGSNDNVTNSAADNRLLMGHSDKINLTILRAGELKQVIVDRFPHKTYWALDEELDTIMVIKENYAYIKLGALSTKEQIDSVMHLAKEMPNIIFDLRDYPIFNAFDFEAHFVDESRAGFQAFEPSLSAIGIFKPSVLDEQQLDSKEHYNGRIIVMVNEFTQSYAESIAMFLQTLPNTVVVGSQTAGANGNTVKMPLPGNIKASFSNIIIEYPDGKQSQKTGITIDHHVIESMEDILENSDPYLKAAEAVIMKHSH